MALNVKMAAILMIASLLLATLDSISADDAVSRDDGNEGKPPEDGPMQEGGKGEGNGGGDPRNEQQREKPRDDGDQGDDDEETKKQLENHDNEVKAMLNSEDHPKSFIHKNTIHGHNKDGVATTKHVQTTVECGKIIARESTHHTKGISKILRHLSLFKHHPNGQVSHQTDAYAEYNDCEAHKLKVDEQCFDEQGNKIHKSKNYGSEAIHELRKIKARLHPLDLFRHEEGRFRDEMEKHLRGHKRSHEKLKDEPSNGEEH